MEKVNGCGQHSRDNINDSHILLLCQISYSFFLDLDVGSADFLCKWSDSKYLGFVDRMASAILLRSAFGA